MPKNRELSQEKLKEILDYDPETGEFRWKVTKSPAAMAGAPAGHIHYAGYRRIMIDGVIFAAHRLAWLYSHGSWPVDQIDHINGVRDDNRISNLREASDDENKQNKGLYRNNVSGHQGVGWHSPSGKWRARIRVGGKLRCVGLFDDIADAIEARAKAKKELHEFQPFDRSAC